MNLNEIKELIDKIDSSNIAYFEVKVDNSYIKMDKSLTRNLVEEKKASNIEETEKSHDDRSGIDDRLSWLFPIHLEKTALCTFTPAQACGLSHSPVPDSLFPSSPS